MIPKLSIITINLNNAIGLQKTIESIVSQTFTDFEYIIIDGGSTDGSIEVIKTFSDKIKVWVSEPDKGLYNAMNKGILRANGRYCLFINSGDFLVNRNVLLKMFSYDYNEDIIYGDLLIDGKKRSFPEKLSLMFFFQTSLGHPSSLIKKELFSKYGLYNENNKIVSDWEFFINVIINHGCTYRYLKNITISYFNEDGISSYNRSILRNEYESVLRRMFPFVYDDYIKFLEIKAKLEYYENSKFLRSTAALYKKFLIPVFKNSKR